MEDYDSASKKIREELVGDLGEVRQDFLEHFSGEAETFVDLMSRSFLTYQELDALVGEDEKKGWVAGLVLNALTSSLISFRLLLSGYQVAAGNIQRQVLECIALALLCSCKRVDVLDRFMSGKYSANKAIRDARRNSKKMRIDRKALEPFEKSRPLYDQFSHPSRISLATQMRFSDEGQSLYVGASFDEGKLDSYRIEVSNRLGLAGVFENFVRGVIQNIEEWDCS